jgi:hypothetical protein
MGVEAKDMYEKPICNICEGVGWDWRRAADENVQVDDPVDHYRCPCVDDRDSVVVA